MDWVAEKAENEYGRLWSDGHFYEGEVLRVSSDLETYELRVAGRDVSEAVMVAQPEEVHFPSLSLVVCDIELENLEKFPLAKDYDLSRHTGWVESLKQGEEQFPLITARPVGDKSYQIVDGNKSLEIARQELEQDSVKCEIYSWDDSHTFRKFIENHISLDEGDAENSYSGSYSDDEIEEFAVKALRSDTFGDIASEDPTILKLINSEGYKVLERLVEED